MQTQATQKRTPAQRRKAKKRIVACQATAIPSGERLIVDLDGKSIDIFNINGEFYALHNRCPVRRANYWCRPPD